MRKEKLISIFDKQSAQYANKKEGAQPQLWRRELLAHAKGRVLELAVGAGANFPFYRSNVKVTATDFSEKMLTEARRTASNYKVDSEFIKGDIEELDFPPASFDTIVSTLSLCSYENPSMVLSKINSWCSQGGQILLMEHGKSSKSLVSLLQKTLNPLLHSLYGCHHTRNIPELIQESGIEIVKIERHWLGMISLIWARPGKI